MSLNYLVTATELLLGVFMLPFNVAHLGQSAYGLWVLVASITIYFSVLDLGYGVSLVRFTAKYRAENNTAALNEIASTMFWIFAAIGVAAFSLAILLSFNLEHIFHLTGDQVRTGRIVFLFISANVALGFPVSVFGGIVNGSQRIYLNGVVALITALVVAAVNVGVLLSGYGIVELVAATTTVRILSYIAYATNAYRVFPELRIRWRYFRRSRLREITGFSVFILLIDIANKLNYSTDTLVVGAFVGTIAVAVWAVAQRLIEIIQRITDQLNSVLFPVVVDSSTNQQFARLQKILLQGTRLSLAMVVPLATGLALLAKPIVRIWVGPNFAGSVAVIYVLSIVVAIRVGNATSAVILKGAGQHQLLAFSNLSMAISNLILSVILVRWYGLVGVAIGTLIPMIVISLFIVFPAACRRVELSPFRIIRKSVWPVLWPAAVMAAALLALRSLNRDGWGFLLLQVVFGGAVYSTLFLVLAISREERQWYLGIAREVLRWDSDTKAAKEFA
jgi:O-antigen/teichoic acid export membrane protein